MSTHDIKHIKIRAIRDWVIVSDMEFGEQVTQGGIVLRSDDSKSHGIKPRWGKVYKIGPDQKDVTVGQWVLIEHGRWTRAIRIHDGERELKIHRADVPGIMLVTDEKPSDVYFGEEVQHGDSINIRPEDFGAR